MNAPATHKHASGSQHSIDWERVGIVVGVCGCLVLLGALAWYAVAIQGTALNQIQAESAIQNAYLDEVGQRIQTMDHPTHSP